MALDISETLTILTGEKPSDSEIAEITRMIHALGVEEYTIFVKMLMFFYHQTIIINNAPNKLKEEGHKLIDDINHAVIKSSNNHIKDITETAKKDLSNAINDATEKIARSVSVRTAWKWISCSILIIGLFISTVSFFVYNSISEKSKAEGIEIGKKINRDEELWLKKQHRFTNSNFFNDTLKIYEEGMLEDIIFMYNSGELEKIIACSGRGWEIEETMYGRMCYPSVFTNRENKKFQVGWKIPSKIQR